MDEFLRRQSVGSIGVDVGCGNGKYMKVNERIQIIGLDQCSELVEICISKGLAAIQASALQVPFRRDFFDFAISIAVIHHFSTAERRIQAIREISNVLKVAGEALIFVWAFEQQGKRKYEGQDAMVSWQSTDGHTYQRYYHLFIEGELEKLCTEIPACKIIRSGFDRDNWFVVLKKTR